MNANEDLLRRYVALRPASAFKWERLGEAIVWTELEKTVAFRDELARAIELLSRARHVPTFTTVVLAFAKLRGVDQSSHESEPVLQQLKKLARDRPYGIAEIVAQILEAKDKSPEDGYAEKLIEGLRSGLPREGLMAESGMDVMMSAHGPKGALRHARDVFETSLKRVDVGEIERRLRTGIDDEVESLAESLSPDSNAPAPDAGALPLDDASRANRLLGELRDDTELGEVARVARHIMAALSLPAPAATLQDLPIGGYADIANRGEIDRLLLSELALDDEVLASRIVHGEALFMRRETPRERPQTDLFVVLDSGIRSWGRTRVFIAAAALAAAASADRRVRVQVVRASGETLETVDLGSREGLLDHLGKLVPDVHPGPALGAAHGIASADAQRVLVTTDAAFADPELRTIVDADAGAGTPWSVITADAGGSIEVLEVTSRGARHLRSMAVDAGTLSLEVTVNAPAVADPSLPVYVNLTPSPLLVGNEIHRARYVECHNGPFVLTCDRRVLFWAHRPKRGDWSGARVGGLDLGLAPAGHLLAFVRSGDGVVVACYDSNNRRFAVAWFEHDGLANTVECPMENHPRVDLTGDEMRIEVDRRGYRVDQRGLHDLGARHKKRITRETQHRPMEPRRSWKQRPPIGFAATSLLRDVRAVQVQHVPGVSKAMILLLGGHSSYMIATERGQEARWRRLHRSGRVGLGGRERALGLGASELESGKSPSRVARFLKVCRFIDGSSIWIDRRGLMHLCSGDRAEGELTLTLDIGQDLEAWMSRGDATPADRPTDGAVSAWLRRFARGIAEANGQDGAGARR